MRPNNRWALRHLRFALMGLVAGFNLAAAQASTLTVGPSETLKTPADAARMAKPGDTVLIAPGTYRSCVVWQTDQLTIRGLGAGPVFDGVVCQGKAIFVVHANDITLENLRFENATAPDGNGAGIRAEGKNLTVKNCVFTRNQDGILSSADPTSALLVTNSTFDGNGACLPGGCAHGIYAGHIGRLRVENSTFTDTQHGHSIKSRAARSEILNNHIIDGPTATASYLIDVPNGGTVLIKGNVLEKGANSENRATAISIGAEGHLQPSDEVLIQDNTLTNDGGPTVFVRNAGTTPVQLVGNRFKGHAVTPLIGPGRVH